MADFLIEWSARRSPHCAKGSRFLVFSRYLHRMCRRIRKSCWRERTQCRIEVLLAAIGFWLSVPCYFETVSMCFFMVNTLRHLLRVVNAWDLSFILKHLVFRYEAMWMTPLVYCLFFFGVILEQISSSNNSEEKYECFPSCWLSKMLIKRCSLYIWSRDLILSLLSMLKPFFVKF